MVPRFYTFFLKKKQQNLTCDEVEHAVSQQQKHALWMAYLEMLVQ